MKHSYKLGLISLAVMACSAGAFAAETGNENSPNILGYLGYSQTGEKNGFYSLDTKGNCTMLWPDTKLGVTGTYFTTGWVRNNAVCGIFGNSSKVFYLEFDLNTGENTVEQQIDIEGKNAYKYMHTGAYNPTDDYVYGFGYNSDLTQDYFIKAPASDYTKCEIVREMPTNFGICKSVCYNPTDNHFYGIDLYDRFIRFDIYGNFEALADLDVPKPDDIAQFTMGLCYSIRDNMYYWNAHYTNYNSDFVSIDPDTFECKIIKEFEWLDQFTFLLCLDNDGLQDGPVAPEMTSFNYKDGSMTGSITYKMPTLLGNGNAAPASMKWTATVLPADVKYTGTAAPGETVTVDFGTDVLQGENTFSMYATADDKRGASVFTNAWIGNDTPYVPQNVRLAESGVPGEFILTWNPVTKSAHNGYIDASGMSYAVFLNGEQITITKECSAKLNYDAEVNNRNYTAMVVALCGGLQGEPGVSNMVTAGRGFPLPFSVIPTAEQAAQMITINVDGDRSGWVLRDNFGEPAFFTSKDYDNPGNDWLITPKLVFPKADTEYTVSFEAALHAVNFNEEYFEVWLGKAATPEDMTMQNIAPRTQVMLGSYEPFEYTFTVPEAGSYHVGIRSVSAADQMGWYLRNLLISGASAVETISAGAASVTAGNGCINFRSLAGEKATVFSADGKALAAKTLNSDSESFTADPGIYIVKIAGNSWKLIVK